MRNSKFFSPNLDDIYEALLDVCNQIRKSGVKIDVIIGISRGGLVPARFLSDLLSIDRIEIVRAEYYAGVMKRMEKPTIHFPSNLDVKGLNILVVDDVADTGDTIIEIEKELNRMGANRILKATLYVKPWNKAKIDFYHQMVDKWIIFPWEIVETIKKVKNEEKKAVYDSLKIPDEIKQILAEIAEE